MKTKKLMVKIGWAKQELNWLTQFDNTISTELRRAWYNQLTMRLKERNLKLPEGVTGHSHPLAIGYECWEMSKVLFAYSAKPVRQYSDKTKLRAELAEIEAQLRSFKELIGKEKTPKCPTCGKETVVSKCCFNYVLSVLGLLQLPTKTSFFKNEEGYCYAYKKNTQEKCRGYLPYVETFTNGCNLECQYYGPDGKCSA
jgi:hypothetical protein